MWRIVKPIGWSRRSSTSDTLRMKLNVPGGLGRNHPYDVHVVMFDGSVRELEDDKVDEETLRFMLQHSDGQVVDYLPD